MNIAVYNHKGGVGKSTITAHLGFYAIENGINTQIIDGDRQRCTIAWLSNHQWNGDISYDVGTVNVTIIDEPVHDVDYLIYDCPPAFEVMEHLKNKIDKWIIPVDGRFSVEGAMAVIEEIKSFSGKVDDIYIVINKSFETSFGRSERKEIDNLGVKVFCFPIPQADVMRKSENIGIPTWKVPYGNRSLSTQNLKLFCKWVYDGFSNKQLV